MIDLDLLRRDAEPVKRALAARGFHLDLVEQLLRIDADWRAQTTELERLRHEHRVGSSAVVTPPAVVPADWKTKLKLLSESVREAEEKLLHLTEERLRLWKRIPNLPHPSVKPGADASANAVRASPPALPAYSFPPRDSLDVGLALGIVDMEHAATASGSRFAALRGDGVRLAFALVQHAMTVLQGEGFTPVLPPVLIRRSGMDAMGYLERGADEVYATQDDLLLVGTSEQSLGAMYQDATFREAELPLRLLAFSSCFRREAGAHGRDVRGIIRLHQFEKVEMFSFCSPTESAREQEAFLAFQKRLQYDLELPHRVVDLCTGDLGFAAASTIDLETWFPARGAFVETSSASNTTDFQTRRLGTKYRSADGSRHLVHAVNGTAYALQRTIAALLEVHQQRDGTVTIPAVLQPYLGGQDALRPPTA